MEHQAVYDRLIQAARAREFVHYGELGRMLGLDLDNPHFATQVGKVLAARFPTSEAVNAALRTLVPTAPKDD